MSAPSVSNVKLSATTMAPGSTVSATYTYSVTGDGGADASVYSWRSVSGQLEAPGQLFRISQSGTVPAYTIKQEDVGKYIQLTLSALDDKGNKGNSILVSTGMYTGGVLQCPSNSPACVAISTPADPVGMVTGAFKGSFKTVAGTSRSTFNGTVYRYVPVQLVPPSGVILKSGVKIAVTTPGIEITESGGYYWLWFKSLPSGKYTASAVYNDGAGKVVTWNLPVLGYVYHRASPDSGDAGMSMNDLYLDRGYCEGVGDGDVHNAVAGSKPNEFWDAVSDKDLGFFDATSIYAESARVWSRITSGTASTSMVGLYPIEKLTGYDFTGQNIYLSSVASENSVKTVVATDTRLLKPGNKPVGHMCWRRF